MIINYFFVKFVTIIKFVYFLLHAGTGKFRQIRLTKYRLMLGAGRRTMRMPTKSIEIVGARDLGHAHFQGNYLCVRSAFPI